MNNDQLIIGMTGAFGSGCTKIAQDFIVPKGFKFLSLSSKLREYCKKEKNIENPDKRTLQDIGNELRSKSLSYLADEVINEIHKNKKAKYFVVDSFRNPHEVEAFRKCFASFYLIGVFADTDIRWLRVKKSYNNNNHQFEEDEKRDKGDDEENYGQRVLDCFINADLIISNKDDISRPGQGSYEIMNAKIQKYIDLFKKPYSVIPNTDESMMAMAYSLGYRSNCLKRKVGAVMVDEFGNTFSSGFNAVPWMDDSCFQKHGKCYRDIQKDDLKNELTKYIKNDKELDDVMKRLKLLEKCRSLHAEENAILNVARFGSTAALINATLYTTTYPCNLCANKIVQVGIKEVVYFEPYPGTEAKKTFEKYKNKTILKPFEGITYKSYFRVFGANN